jgi:hypothetical protein
MSLKRRERRERARRDQELREELRADFTTVVVKAEAAEKREGMEMMNRSDDGVDTLMPRGPSVDGTEVMVWHEPSGQMLPLWTARSLDKAALNDANYPSAPPFGVHPDAVVAATANPPRVRYAEQKEEAGMRQGEGGSENGSEDCGDDCNEGRTDKAMAVARGVVKRDQEPPEDDPEDDPDLEEDEPDLEEAILVKVLECMQRFGGKLDELEALRARNRELERMFAAESVGSDIERSVEPQPLLN